MRGELGNVSEFYLRFLSIELSYEGQNLMLAGRNQLGVERWTLNVSRRSRAGLTYPE